MNEPQQLICGPQVTKNKQRATHQSLKWSLHFIYRRWTVGIVWIFIESDNLKKGQNIKEEYRQTRERQVNNAAMDFLPRGTNVTDNI